MYLNSDVTINGKTYRFLDKIPSLDSDDMIVLCEDDEKKLFVCSHDLWVRSIKKVETVTSVHAKSPAQEKMELFMSMFHGREDVFAKRYYNFKTQKSGYVPVCKNEWEPDLCDKRKNKCIDCPNRSFIPVSAEVIRQHLLGHDQFCRDVIGIYPMLPGDTTWILCADFDDENWEDDVSVFCDVARDIGLTPAVERSRSGNGAHVWLFFETPVPAATARKLGSGLLTRAMERRHELNFQSYDRLFPSQDTMPNGGFGNLIALPFQGQARKNGNSVFVDSQFIPYRDQWALLSALPKLSLSELENCVSTVCVQSDVGILVDTSESKPWEKKRISKEKLADTDFPAAVNLTLGKMLYIEKAGFSQRALNRIKRFAAFRNPDFYKSQAMRLPIYEKPRVIDCGEETNEYLIIPRGCLDSMIELLDIYSVNYLINDERNVGNSINVNFNGQLRAEQVPAAESLLAHEMGVLSATTAFGKTVVGAYLIGTRKTNTLILVHSSALLSQWKSALEQFLTIDEALPDQPKKRGRRKQRSLIGQLGGGKSTISGIVDIAIMQSLFENKEKDVKEFVENYGMVICDECHHAAAFSFEKVLKAVNPTYIYGLSATPTRQDGHHPIIFMQCGPVRYLVDAKAQAEKREFSHYVVPRLTKLRLPDADGIQSVYSGVILNEMRNALIIKDAVMAVDAGRSPVLLTERKEHAMVLADALQGKANHVLLLIGSDSQKEKRNKMDVLKTIAADESLIIVATGKYIGEGFDEPRLDTLLLAMPISWKGTLAQYVGRLHRNYEGKHDVRVYDYVDIHVPMLERMYQKRLRGYAELGYQTMSAENDEAPGLIYTGANYGEVFLSDVAVAGREIVLVAPTISKNRVSSILKTLPLTFPKGKLTIVTLPIEDYKLEQQSNASASMKILIDTGVSIIEKSGLSQKFAVVDGSVVWYGNINYLSFSKADDTALRLESPEIAGELVEQI